MSSRVHSKQLQQKAEHDQQAQDKSFAIDDPVFVRNFGHSGPTWLPGIIIEARGDLTFHIELNDGRVFHRHINHIRHRTCAPSSEHTDENTDDFLPSPAGNVNNHPHTIANAPPTASHRSTHATHPPDRFM